MTAPIYPLYKGKKSKNDWLIVLVIIVLFYIGCSVMSGCKTVKPVAGSKRDTVIIVKPVIKTEY